MSENDFIRLPCPKCQKKLRVNASSAGKNVRCPDKACAALIAVPARAQDEVAAEPRPTARARWPWIAGGAAALSLVLVVAGVLSLGVWALNRSAQQTQGPTKEGLRGAWEGISKDGTTVELIFTDQFVTVAILPPGVDLAKGRTAAEFVSGNIVRGMLGGGIVIGNAGYEIDVAKKELLIDSAVAKFNEGGTLVLAGQIQLGNSTVSIPETKLERMAPKSANADPPAIAKTGSPTNDGASFNNTATPFKPGDWFLWKSTIDGGKTSSTNKHTITRTDDKVIFYEIESTSGADKATKKATGKFAVESLGKSPVAAGDARNEILGKGKETLHIAGQNIACDWVEYKSSEAGDPMKYKINGIAYGETIVTNTKVWYSAQVPALVVKNESRTSHIVPPQVLKKWIPADVSSIYELIDLGSNASVGFEAKKTKSLVKENSLGNWEGKDRKVREGKLRAALKLCGSTCFATTAFVGEINDILGDMVKKGEGDLSEKFPRAAQKIAEKYPEETFEIRFQPPDEFTLKHLQSMLGKADFVGDSVFKTAGSPGAVSWHWYDWCAFGVLGDGRIIGLAADPKKVVDAPGKQAPPAPVPNPKSDAPKLQLAQFAGEWAELKLGHYLHLDADGFGFGLVRLFGVHTVEMRLRQADGKLILDFPDEVNVGLGRRELRSKPMTVRLTDPATLELSDSTGMLWYRLTKSTVARKPPTLSDFAGDWRIWSVTADGKGGKDLSGRERVLKLKSVKLSLSPDGKGNARFTRDDKDQGPAIELSFKQVGEDFVLSGLDDTIWRAKFFYIGDKERTIRLRTQDGATRMYTYTRAVPAEKTPKQNGQEPAPKKAGAKTLPPEVGSLRQPKGPRLKELAKPPAAIALDAIYLAGPFMRDKRSKEWPQAFAAGTDETCIVLVLREVPMGTQVGAEVASAAGPVRLAPSTVRTIRTAAGTVIELSCAPASGAYADGDYTTRVLINRTAVAELNWCVGGKEPARNVIALAGTVWQSRYSDGSGYELHFRDGGKLDVHALTGAGKSTWQTKKGSWQQDDASFSGFADQDGSKRRRIEFRGKLIDGDLGIRIRNENEQGAAGSFGNRYEIPRAKKQ
jgi:hypothetical protein